MTRFNRYFVPILLLTLVTGTGCWDRKDLEERTSVVALAFDKPKDQKGMIRISIQIPNPKKIAGGGGGQTGTGGMEAVEVMTSTGLTVTEALYNIQKRLNQELFYGHTRILAVSEEMARDGMDAVVDMLRRTPQIRRLLWPIVVKGEAKKLLEANLQLEEIPIMYVMDMMINSSKMGVTPDITLGTVFNNLSDSTREPDMNMIEPTKDEIKWAGLAVFKETKMIGVLDSNEVPVLLQIRDQKIGGPVAAFCDQKNRKRVVFRTKTARTKQKFQIQNGQVTVMVHVRLEGDIIESQCDITFSDQKELKRIEDSIAAELKDRANRLLRRSQNDLKLDVFAFGTDLRAHFPSWWSHEKWEREYPNAKIQFTYDVNIRRTGMETK